MKFIIPEDDNRKRFCCPDCGEIFYSNPNVVVGALSVHDNKILMAKRNIFPRKDKWTLPAGFLENGETLQEGAIRETQEETNLQRQEIEMLGTFDPLISRHGVLVHPFVATGKFEYQLTPNEEIESIFLVPIDYLMKSQNIVWEDLSRDGKELNVPSWSYNNYKIWGLTAMFTTIFLNRCFNAEIELNFL